MEVMCFDNVCVIVAFRTQLNESQIRDGEAPAHLCDVSLEPPCPGLESPSSTGEASGTGEEYKALRGGGMLSRKPGLGVSSTVRRVAVLIGIVVGVVMHVGAFSINAPIAVCASESFSLPPDLAGAGVAIATTADFRKEWAVIVVSRCDLTFTTGTHTSNVVVEWGPSVIAITGLVLATASLSVWLDIRARDAKKAGNASKG